MRNRQDLHKDKSGKIPLISLQAQQLIERMPYWERRLWKRLNKCTKGRVWEPKAIVGDHILDFYCAEVQLVIELVGNTSFPQTLHRNQQFLSRGFTVLPFPPPNSEVDVNNILFRVNGELRHLKKRGFPQRQSQSQGI